METPILPSGRAVDLYRRAGKRARDRHRCIGVDDMLCAAKARCWASIWALAFAICQHAAHQLPELLRVVPHRILVRYEAGRHFIIDRRAKFALDVS